MSEEGQIDYQQIAREALRDVVRRVLARTAAEGLPGEHHFYLTFDTHHPGVELSESIRNVYPNEMTIVLQHQFWDLEVDEESFAVTLRFGGAKQRVSVPFAALKTFVDPAAEFGLNLELVDEQVEEDPQTKDTVATEQEKLDTSGGGDVVSIDRFRKKP